MINFFKHKNKFKNSGFTLVEMLVAVSIFTVAILTIMTILGQNISDTTYAKRKLVASYLAQEGIEYIRNMRDTYVLFPAPGKSWNNFKATLAPCNSGNGCGFVDPSDSNIFVCNNSRSCELYLNNNVSYSTVQQTITRSNGETIVGVGSGFVRKIWAETVGSDEIKIHSAVYWTQGTGEHNVEFTENLFNWVE